MTVATIWIQLLSQTVSSFQSALLVILFLFSIETDRVDDSERLGSNNHFREELMHFASRSVLRNPNHSSKFNNGNSNRFEIDIFGVYNFPSQSKTVRVEFDVEEDDEKLELGLMSQWHQENVRESVVGFDLVMKVPCGKSTQSVKSSLKIASTKKKKMKNRHRSLIGKDQPFNNDDSNTFSHDDNDANILSSSMLTSRSKVRLRSWFFEDIETKNIVAPFFGIKKDANSLSILTVQPTPLCRRLQPNGSCLHQPKSFCSNPFRCCNINNTFSFHSASFFTPYRFSPSSLSPDKLNLAILKQRPLKTRRHSFSQLTGLPFNSSVSNSTSPSCLHLLPRLSIPRGLNHTPSHSYRGKRFSYRFRSSEEDPDDELFLSHHIQYKRRRLCPRSLALK